MSIFDESTASLETLYPATATSAVQPGGRMTVVKAAMLEWARRVEMIAVVEMRSGKQNEKWY